MDVTNTSERSGTEVVQLYIAPPESTLHRPPIELKGYAKLALEPGETKTASITLNFRSFAYFDPAISSTIRLTQIHQYPERQGPGEQNPDGMRARSIWPLVARSATNHHAVIEWELSGEENYQHP